MRKPASTKVFSWYYIFAFLAIFGLGVYFYSSFRVREGATTQPPYKVGDLVWFIAGPGSPVVAGTFLKIDTPPGSTVSWFETPTQGIVIEKIVVGTSVRVYASEDSGELKNGKINKIEKDKEKYNITVTFDDSTTGVFPIDKLLGTHVLD